MSTPTYRLSVWTKPGTNERRIYVSGGIVQPGDKLYIFPGPDAHMPWDARLQARSGIGYTNRGRGSHQYDIGLEIAGEALAERGLDRLGFSEIVAALGA